MSNVVNLVSGLDIGNGYVKGLTQCLHEKPEVIDISSVAVRVTDPNDIALTANEIPGFMQDIVNRMEVSFSSPVAPQDGRWLFGNRALDSGKDPKEFDVSNVFSKAKQDLSGILILGCLAARGLGAYYEAMNTLPTDLLDVHVGCVLALPISEYRDFRADYVNGFKKDSHVVTFHDFDPMVRVRLTFDDIGVLPEGASANYAISSMGTDFFGHILESARQMNPMLNEITPEMVQGATNTLGIDVGEGTVNFPVFTDGKFNADASTSLNVGYGTVLRSSMASLKRKGYPFQSRKSLADFLVKGPDPLNRVRYNNIKDIVEKEIDGLVDSIQHEFSDVLTRIGAYVQVIYVYGGGSGPIKDKLYPVLQRITDTRGGYPLFYMGASYSRKLNREGMFIAAKARAQASGFAPGIF